MLSDALSELYGKVISLTICEDDDVSMKTPLEWRQAIYEEMLAQARQSIVTDKTIQTLLTFLMRNWMKRVSGLFNHLALEYAI